MAYYRSAFNPADTHADGIQKFYLDLMRDKKLSGREKYQIVLDGCSQLHDIFLSTETTKKQGKDFYSRLNKLYNKIKKREQTRSEEYGYPWEYEKGRKAGVILKLQLEYITLAGIFGRPSIKIIPDKDNTGETIKNIIENDDEDLTEDVEPDTMGI